MSYWQLFYHVVFATEERRPLVTPELAGIVGALVREKATALSCVVHAAHVQPEHVHLVLSIPPNRAVGNVVGQIKGNSSHAMTASFPALRFGWQTGYGVFSFGKRNLPAVVSYVQDQEQRHASGRLEAELERTSEAG